MSNAAFVTPLLSSPLMPLVPTADVAESHWFAKGVDAYTAGNYTKAAQYFAQAGAEGLESPALWLNLGLSRLQMGAYEAATTAFQRLQECEGWEAYGSYYLGRVSECRGHNNEAVRRYRQAARQAQHPPLMEHAEARLSAAFCA